MGIAYEECFLKHSQEYRDKCKTKPGKEPIAYETARHELWPVSIDKENEAIVNEIVESVIDEYALFGDNDDASE